MGVFTVKLRGKGDVRVCYEDQIFQWSEKELQKGFLILHDGSVQVRVSKCKVRE